MNEEEEALNRLLATYRDQREDGDPTRTEYGFMVILTVPNRIDRESVEREILKSIEFGHPVISLLYDVPAPRRIEVVTDTSARL